MHAEGMTYSDGQKIYQLYQAATLAGDYSVTPKGNFNQLLPQERLGCFQVRSGQVSQVMQVRVDQLLFPHVLFMSSPSLYLMSLTLRMSVFEVFSY